jgi:hypothetical protein
MGAAAKRTISHAQIERAVRYFIAHGGFIQKLPDEKVALLATVGSRAQGVAASLGLGGGSELRLDSN